MRDVTRSVFVGATLLLLGSSCGGRSTLDYGVPLTGGGGSGADAGLGGTGGVTTGGSGGVINNGGAAGLTGNGGSGGVIGTGGTAGTGATGGSGGSGPLACVQCVGQQCPQVQQCIMDQACRQGATCVVQKCLSGGGGGGINFQCVMTCFNGNLSAGMKALQGLQCVFSKCGTQCKGSIPGLPGGGLPGGSDLPGGGAGAPGG